MISELLSTEDSETDKAVAAVDSRRLFKIIKEYCWKSLTDQKSCLNHWVDYLYHQFRHNVLTIQASLRDHRIDLCVSNEPLTTRELQQVIHPLKRKLLEKDWNGILIQHLTKLITAALLRRLSPETELLLLCCLSTKKRNAAAATNILLLAWLTISWPPSSLDALKQHVYRKMKKRRRENCIFHQYFQWYQVSNKKLWYLSIVIVHKDKDLSPCHCQPKHFLCFFFF